MDSSLKNIGILVELLKKNGINQIVISPGGTNIPFVKAVQDDEYFSCYSVVDERSAIYFAIGIYLQTGKIVATSCTSAQATRNYIPGLTEAFYKKVPILAITMSKHPRFTYQEYMQAPDQTSLPNDCVKKSYALPFISDENDVFHSIRLANQAILELTHNGFGPVQLCIPCVDFPLGECSPLVRNIDRYNVEEEWDIALDRKKIMIVVGEHRPFTKNELNAIEAFCNSYDTVVYTNHLSNYHGRYSINANLALATMTEDEFDKTYTPDIIITIGGQTGDYPLYNMLSKARFTSIEHWRVSVDGDVVDTYDKLAKIFDTSERYFLEKLSRKECSVHDYYHTWMRAIDEKSSNMALPFSNASIAQFLCNKILNHSVLQFSILNSLRIWSFFGLDPSIECYSNVGAFGIDGGMSTLIGQSAVTEKLCFMVIGDLAFYYDMNAIGIRHIKNNLRILLINNNGGIEFKLGGYDNENLNRYIAAGDHFKNAEGWAKTCGFDYLSAQSMSEFIEQSCFFLKDSNSPILFEVFVSDIDEAAAYKAIIGNNSSKTFGDLLKKSVKIVLGDEKIKRMKDWAK